jgi:hypothetical protein
MSAWANSSAIRHPHHRRNALIGVALLERAMPLKFAPINRMKFRHIRPDSRCPTVPLPKKSSRLRHYAGCREFKSP